MPWPEKANAAKLNLEDLPLRVAAESGHIGGGHSGGTRGYAGWGDAGVAPSSLAEEVSGQ